MKNFSFSIFCLSIGLLLDVSDGQRSSNERYMTSMIEKQQGRQNFELLSSSSMLRTEDDGNVHQQQQQPLPPNIFDATYSYNVLLGMTPSEQRVALVGMPMFTLSGTRGTSGTTDDATVPPSLPYNQPLQVSDMFVGERCEYTGISDTVFWSTSTKTLSRQAESSTNGIDMEIDIGASLGDFITASTTVRNALLFGNSRTTTVATVQRNAGYTHQNVNNRRIVRPFARRDAPPAPLKKQSRCDSCHRKDPWWI